MRAARRARSLALLAAGALVLAADDGCSAAPQSDAGQSNASQPHAGTPRAASAATGPVAGERYAWAPVAIGGGGFITGLAGDTAGRVLLARTDVHGAYAWDAAADRWRQLATARTMPPEVRRQNGVNEGAYEVAAAPSDPDRLFMAIKGLVYRSRDGGRHWAAPRPGAPFPIAWDANGPFRLYGPFMAVSPRDPDLVLIGTPADGVWRSVDGGVGWSRVAGLPATRSSKPEPTPARRAPGALIWFEPTVPGREPRVWASIAGSGVFVSTDRGASFQPLAPGPAAPVSLNRGAFARDGSFYGVDGENRRLHRFRDGQWSDLTSAPGLGSRWPFAAVAADPHGDAVVVVDAAGSGWRSTDGGARWWPLARTIAVGPGEPPWLHVADQPFFAMADIRFDPAGGGRLWAGTGVGVYRGDLGTDPTIRWTSHVRGIEELVATEAVQPPHGAPLFAVWDFGIHLKSDLDAFSRTYGPRERVLIAAQQVAATPADPRFLVTNASDTRVGCCSQDGQSVLAGYSTDGGATWQRFATLPQPPGTDAADPWRMAFGTIAVAADSPDNIVWEPASNRSPFYTRDRGRTWQRVTLPGEVLPFTGSFGAYYLARRTLVADPVLPGTFYLVHSGDGANPGLAGLWRTSDGGARWQRVFAGEIAPASRFAAKLRAVPGRAGELFFTSSVADGADTRLRRSRDGGYDWTALDGIDHVDDVAFGRAAAGAAYPTIFLSGRVRGVYGIWRSVDDAASWARIAEFPADSLDQVVSLAADPDVFGRVYIGYLGSGWLYGEPAGCAVGEDARIGRSCEAVR